MPAPTPEFFTPPPAPRPSRVGYSAPVSRSIPSGGSGRRSSPGKVTLSPQEVEAAKITGLTIEQYAKEKIEYQRQLEAGEYRDNRENADEFQNSARDFLPLPMLPRIAEAFLARQPPDSRRPGKA